MKKINLNIYSLSITKVLILLSLLGTLAVFFYPKISIFGLNDYYLKDGNYFFFTLQIMTYNFLHGGLFHFLFNSIFIYYFGSILEIIMGRKKFIIFFLFITIFNSIFIINFSANNSTTIGISGFAMALLSYYTLDLKAKNNPEYTGGITAIVLNIIIGFIPGISLLGHLFGAIGGVIFYFLNKDFFKKKMVGAIE